MFSGVVRTITNHLYTTMKKLFLLLTVVMAFAFSAKAHVSSVATLSHEGKVVVFYSANALKEAYEAAVNGDVITLSAGSFESPGEIKKNITIRGAGMMYEDDSNTKFEDNLTIIHNEFSLRTNEANDTIHQFVAEGLFFTGDVNLCNTNNSMIAKCRLKRLFGSEDRSASIRNIKILHSIIVDCEIVNGDYIISNSYLKTNRIDGNMTVQNCVIEGSRYYSWFDFYGLMANSVLINNSYINTSSAVVRNCICIGSNSDFFTYYKEVVSYENKVFSEDTEVFKEGTTTYELTDANKTAWIGSDGTEIGMHGGQLPFTTQLSNPQITKFEVASKTDSEGKLSVNIEVKVD